VIPLAEEICPANVGIWNKHDQNQLKGFNSSRNKSQNVSLNASFTKPLPFLLSMIVRIAEIEITVEKYISSTKTIIHTISISAPS
jgi:hypothetical protein